MSELIITNGDSAADLLAEAGLVGRILPWRDVLHEGPLLPSTSLQSFSDLRAAYLAQRFGLPYGDARADFLTRDATMNAHGLFDRITIWLEHDLFDQLQLLEILHFLHRERRTEGVVLVQADDFIATRSPDTVLGFRDAAIDVTPAMMSLAALLWDALTSPSPDALTKHLRTAMGAFRFLRAALGRFLEELPSRNGGLSRSERVMLSVVSQGGITPQDVFVRLLASEEAAFMGDWNAFKILDDLSFAPEPLVAGLEGEYPCRGDREDIEAYLGSALSLTNFGRSVLRGRADTITINGIDRWWAGTHMTGFDAWRWDSGTRQLVPPGGAVTSGASKDKTLIP